MHYRHDPIITNLVVYSDRDDVLFAELSSVPSSYRAERLRNLATIGIIVSPLLGATAPDGIDESRLEQLLQCQRDSASDTTSPSQLTLKLTINGYNYPELYRDILAMPPGSVSARVKMLATAGAVLTRITRTLQLTGDSVEVAAPSVRAGASEGTVEEDGATQTLDEERPVEAKGEKNDAETRKRPSAIGTVKM